MNKVRNYKSCSFFIPLPLFYLHQGPLEHYAPQRDYIINLSAVAGLVV